MTLLAQILLLLGITVAIVVLFQRLRIPTSLGYLLVGVIVSPFTFGPVIDVPEFSALAEFGVVFLLFTIGLDYSLPQIHALRGQVLILGTAQVALCTAVVALTLWSFGMSGPAAFAIGAIFAQSSSTVIGSLLGEQGEDATPHGRLGLAMSVFQDVTAVPFIVIIPALGVAASANVIAMELVLAIGKAAAAFALVYLVGKRLLNPLFGTVSRFRSSELFTLTVLLVALTSAWATNAFGLSLAFGAFLAGMMLGDTVFRHQVESSIRPFRDVLLGLFFIGIGMMLDPAALPEIWHWALGGTLLILVTKIAVVVVIVRRSGIEPLGAWRTALLLAVGGEFGFAILAIATQSNVLDGLLGQVALTSTLFAIIAGALLIRFNGSIAARLVGPTPLETQRPPEVPSGVKGSFVLIGGYGRVGRTICVLLQNQGIDYMAFDMDLARVVQGRAAGHQVLYGDISEPELLTAVHAERASLVVVTIDDPTATYRCVSTLSNFCPHVPIVARARDLDSSERLLTAGAAHAYPEAIEASLSLGAITLKMLAIPQSDIDAIVQEVRDWGYSTVADDQA